ncbi:hypothetical protein GOC68_22475 [Sinorhizobium medicae]|nr:hypothetical protein [Sinorhizobium medicae]
MEWRLLAVILALFPSASAYGANTLFCAAERSTGFVPENGEWKSADFKTQNSKLLIAPTKIPDNYEIKEVGQKTPRHTCVRNKFNDGTYYQQMVCGGLGYGIIVNFETLRFVEVYTIGYIDNDQSGDNTPAITVGKCSEIPS